jgi:alkanesulfonate monooxygenase SsuD/methylene tetrahydromethanopterin reductase-like flavin-dependent oxidoreductase (luciferase family)
MGAPGLRRDIIALYESVLNDNGFSLTPDHLVVQASAYVADSKAQAIKEAAPYTVYFNQTLFSHGNVTDADPLRDAGYMTSKSFDYIRPENLAAVARTRDEFRSVTLADVERQAQTLPWGTAEEVRDRIIADADAAGAGTVLVSLNRGAMPQAMFLEQIRRFGAEVLPALQAHEVPQMHKA